ncbi:MAG: IS6 family transposase [Brevundimonas sp.]|nr:DDE-type integrase/transposase/recombinase [Brevundimonas sp.]MBJ7484079.1 IS6 family transposase [Brevundimonas sp.]
MKKIMKRHGRVKSITTDGLRSYKAAMKEIGNTSKHEIGRWAKNRVENSYLSFRRRERAIVRFRQMKTLPKFSFVHAAVHSRLNQDRHLTSRETSKTQRSAALAVSERLAG